VKKKAFLLLFSIACFYLIRAQEDERRFYIRPALGIQGAQIDGDYYAGYNQAGIFAGVYAGRDISEKTALSFGLVFSQKGARKNANPEKGFYDYYRARLNYIEIPLQVTYHFRRFDLYGGGYYARLISFKEENQNGVINTGLKFRNDDIGYLLGGEGKIKEKFMFGIRYAYSLVPIRKYSGTFYYFNFLQKVFNKGLYNNTLTIYFLYNINPGKKSD
jgi:hypothetical protein